MKEIYLDNAAATPVDPGVIRAVVRAMAAVGHPGAFNDAGRRASAALEESRAGVAEFLGARPGEIVFCASGSEANRLALTGFTGKGHLVTVATEHQSVLDAARDLRRRGWSVTVLPVDGEGSVSPRDVAAALRRGTKVVSVMYANNEIGTIQPIRAIAKIIRDYRRRTGGPFPYLHVDASQAAAWLPMEVHTLGADLLTLNGAKVHGPRGIAALYVRRGVPVTVDGGEGDPALAAGLAEAVRRIRPIDAVRVARLRDDAIAGILRALPGARLNGPAGDGRTAGNINVSIPETTSEELLLELDHRGIRAGAGSACTAHSVEPSHVLRAIGLPRKHLGGVLRISLSRMTTASDIRALLRALPAAVAAVRRRRA